MVSSGPAPQDSAGLRITRQASPPGLVLAGDIDELTRPALLAELGLLPGGRVHLYLDAVEYCDLAGLRALLGLAEAGPAGPPRQVVLHGLPPWLARVLAIVGWDASPGVVIT